MGGWVLQATCALLVAASMQVMLACEKKHVLACYSILLTASPFPHQRPMLLSL
jgi:hypothetical protein